MTYKVTQRLVLTPNDNLVPEDKAIHGGRLYALPGDVLSDAVAQRYGLVEVETESRTESAPALDGLTKAELAAYAEAHGIEGVTTSMKKDEMVEAIQEAETETKQAQPEPKPEKKLAPGLHINKLKPAPRQNKAG